MSLGLTALELARIQFAFTVSFHIIFPATSIGLACFLAMLEWKWLRTQNPIYKDLFKYWIKIFAVAFAMGVVSGIVMAYQFGTNWSEFSRIAGSVTGPLLTYEVMSAFFLEAGFLGIMLFGWGRVSPKAHFFATLMVAIGTCISMFWILSSNSWMQTPQGFAIENGIIVARTDSLGAGLTKQIAVTNEPGDLGDLYNSFLDGDYIQSASDIQNGDVVVKANGKLLKPKRLQSGLFQFKAGSGVDRVVLDCITSLQHGADLLWIETEKPHVGQIAEMVNRIREVVPNAKLVYNNSPSFNWTLNFRQQVFDAWKTAGKDVSAYDRAKLMSADYDTTELAQEADNRIQTFQADAAREAGIFHHLITLPTYHTAALSTDNLAKEYFGAAGMLGYVAGVQRKEIRQGIACVKHQNMSGSDIGDDHKEYFSGEAALKASGKDNTMNQFS